MADQAENLTPEEDGLTVLGDDYLGQTRANTHNCLRRLPKRDPCAIDRANECKRLEIERDDLQPGLLDDGEQLVDHLSLGGYHENRPGAKRATAVIVLLGLILFEGATERQEVEHGLGNRHGDEIGHVRREGLLQCLITE